jgi:myo-inositol 2-dehydrogenase/D-chiro-inositol 1-dehydrogenase
MMIHDFDMARFLSGSEVTEVFACGTAIVNEKIADVGDVDTAIVTLKFANGALGVIDNSRRACYGYDQRTEVHGSLGSVRTENDRPSLAVVSTAGGVTAEKPLWFFLERYNDAFIKEVEDFRDALLSGGKPPVTGEDALKNVLVAAAATKSLKEGRPVRIDEML